MNVSAGSSRFWEKRAGTHHDDGPAKAYESLPTVARISGDQSAQPLPPGAGVERDMPEIDVAIDDDDAVETAEMAGETSSSCRSRFSGSGSGPRPAWPADDEEMARGKPPAEGSGLVGSHPVVESSSSAKSSSSVGPTSTGELALGGDVEPGASDWLTTCWTTASSSAP
jgi:hypothetical protein